METENIYGSTAFKHLTGADNFKVRLMEAGKVISPQKTSGGWRIFTQADVQRAREWMAQHAKRRRA